MTTSRQQAPLTEPGSESDAEFDLLVQEAPQHGGSHVWSPGDRPGPGSESAVDHSQTSAVWRIPDDDERAANQLVGAHSAPAAEYAAAPGVPGRGVIVATVGATASVAALNIALVGGLTFFFDVCFVVVGLVVAMAVRRQDLFTAAVLPPLAFAGVIAAVAVLFPEAILPAGSMSKVFMTGLTAHADGLVGGYGAALLTVGARAIARRQD